MSLLVSDWLGWLFVGGARGEPEVQDEMTSTLQEHME